MNSNTKKGYYIDMQSLKNKINDRFQTQLSFLISGLIVFKLSPRIYLHPASETTKESYWEVCWYRYRQGKPVTGSFLVDGKLSSRQVAEIFADRCKRKALILFEQPDVEIELSGNF